MDEFYKKRKREREYGILTYIVDIVLLTIPAAAVLPIRFGGNLIKHDKSLKLEKLIFLDSTGRSHNGKVLKRA